MAVRNVISTLNPDGTEVMGPGILMYHYPGADIMNGSLLTVESNHFCVLKSRGAILNVYETGQYPVNKSTSSACFSIKRLRISAMRSQRRTRLDSAPTSGPDGLHFQESASNLGASPWCIVTVRTGPPKGSWRLEEASSRVLEAVRNDYGASAKG